MQNNLSIKRYLYELITKQWCKFISDPTGFPETPSSDTCWLWVGSKNTGVYKYVSKSGLEKPIIERERKPYPIAYLFGGKVSPRSFLFAMHHNILSEDVPRIRTTCGNRMCVNPLHQRPSDPACTVDLKSAITSVVYSIEDYRATVKGLDDPEMVVDMLNHNNAPDDIKVQILSEMFG